MIKARIAVAAVVMLFAAQLMAPAQIKTPAKEEANISMHFPSVPIFQLFSMYAAYAKEKVLVSDNVMAGKNVSIVTDHRLTKSQALQVIEHALWDKAQIKILRNHDGVLIASSEHKIQTPPGASVLVRSYLPNGRIDPPMTGGPGFPGGKPLVPPPPAK